MDENTDNEPARNEYEQGYRAGVERAVSVALQTCNNFEASDYEREAGAWVVWEALKQFLAKTK